MSSKRIFSPAAERRLKPVVTHWYKRVDTGEVFEVIAVDVTDGVVDVQNLEGEVAEMNIATWRKLKLIRAIAPQWSEQCMPYDTDRDITSLNSIWDSWQQGSGAMH